ncbi:hypothetical protein FDP41_009714 [Naegleria fowleri]|uniref:Uncharacterized protein n=1 Tax=Naegleria fowleri TaxID=5763 RepID=A0A6A5BDL8_NAEFO|nr:uncharacterized protein FDP41_009714 [Naegleria fowleri]KAF0972018.1 hypothetical protein FDP41_009714 [Naegleria fowleri]
MTPRTSPSSLTSSSNNQESRSNSEQDSIKLEASPSKESESDDVARRGVQERKVDSKLLIARLRNEVRPSVPFQFKSLWLVFLLLIFIVLGLRLLTSDRDFLYWKPELHKSLLKKANLPLNGQDPLFNMTKRTLVAFKPLLAKIVPSFHDNILQNQKFQKWLLKSTGNET